MPYFYNRYEGRSMIRYKTAWYCLFLQYKNIQNIGFVHNLNLTIRCEYYYNDITVASCVNDKYGDVTVENIPVTYGTAFCY